MSADFVNNELDVGKIVGEDFGIIRLFEDGFGEFLGGVNM